MLNLDHIRISKNACYNIFYTLICLANSIDTYLRLKIVLCGNFKLKCVCIELIIKNPSQIYFCTSLKRTFKSGF